MKFKTPTVQIGFFSEYKLCQPDYCVDMIIIDFVVLFVLAINKTLNC